MKKKYQVFVSSTFTDLRVDRQVAVEAILSAGHIPAGMELFSAGNESQLNVIKRWIDESDIYMLILGGRYGSTELNSGKSYTQLEYEYALEKNKPLFAVVMTEDLLNSRIKELGQEVLELNNRDKFNEFKALVLSKVCRFYDDPKDIKIAIFETLNDFHQRLEMNGWISGKMIQSLDKYVEEITLKENEIRELRTEIEKKNFLPNLESEQQLFFKESDVKTRVNRITSCMYFEEIEDIDADDGDYITWIFEDENKKENIDISMLYVCDDFIPYYMHEDKSFSSLSSIGFVFVDNGKRSINLNDLLYQVRLQIDEIPQNANLEFSFIMVSERMTSIIEEKLQEAFDSIFLQCKPKVHVELEVWNKEKLYNLEKELGLIYIEDDVIKL